VERKRYDVIAKGPTVLSSHDLPAPAAEEAKKAALEQTTPVEVWDHELKRVIFRAKSGQWRWITR